MEVIESDKNVNQATVFNKCCASCETRDLSQQDQQLQPIVMYIQHIINMYIYFLNNTCGHVQLR